MKKIIILSIVSIILLSCGGSTSDNIEFTETSIIPTETKLPATKTPIPLTSTLVETQIPTATNTPAPIIDSNGNITWRPKQVLIISEEIGGDGVSYNFPPNFLLLWDGTLFQPENGKLYVSHLDNQEVCKFLNTVDSSGFFEEPQYYTFPFDGAGSEYVLVNSWKTSSSGGQILGYAISGAPFYDVLYCRNCPRPSADNIIKPGLANIYFLLKNYYSENRQVVQFDKLRVYIDYTEEPATHSWPFNTISLSDFFQKCDQELYCLDIGMEFNGNIAKEMFEKGDSSQVFEFPDMAGSFRLRYRAVWPYEPYIIEGTSEYSTWKEMPSNYTLTCNPSMGTFPILPLDLENQFWYYAPDGKWAAELISEPNQTEQIRIVNTSGYEKYYQYDPALFGQTEIKVFPRYWTKNGKYFFANILPSTYNSQKTPFVNSVGLQRISIENGKLDYVFIGIQGESFAYNLSEEHGKIAYIRQGDFPLKLTIKDTFSLKEEAVTLSMSNNNIQYTDAGTIVWSPDGSFLFVAANYKVDEKINTVVIKIDTSNPTVQSIVYQEDKALKLISDFGPHNAKICPLTDNIESYCSLYLDLETGMIK